MIFLEVVFVCIGWNYRFLYGSAGTCLYYGRIVLFPCICSDYFYHYSQSGIWRSDIGLAITGMHYFSHQWRTAVLHGNYRAISVQDISGSEKKADLSGKGRTVTEHG